MDPSTLQTVPVVPVACVLRQICLKNESRKCSKTSRFQSLSRVPITVEDYLTRIYKYSGCSSACIIFALIYVDRLIVSNSIILNFQTLHRFLITSVMVAAKFFDDHYFNNQYYAKVGGVSLPELNLLELEFLFLIRFDLFVSKETFFTYLVELQKHSREHACWLTPCPEAVDLNSVRTKVRASLLSAEPSKVQGITPTDRPTPIERMNPQLIY